MQRLTFDDAETLFVESVLPLIKQEYESDGIPDWPARCEGWCNFIDYLNKSGVVSDQDAYDWPHPECNYRPGEER